MPKTRPTPPRRSSEANHRTLRHARDKPILGGRVGALDGALLGNGEAKVARVAEGVEGDVFVGVDG